MDHQRREEHNLHPSHRLFYRKDSTRESAERENDDRRKDTLGDDYNEESLSSHQPESPILSKAERKRQRERKRRSDVNKGFDALAKILVKVDPQFQEETRRFWEANKRREGALDSGGDGRMAALPLDIRDGMPHFLNRSELINRAVDIIGRLHQENEDQKHQINILKEGRAKVNCRGDDDDDNHLPNMLTRSSRSSVSSTPVQKSAFVPSEPTETRAPKPSSGINSDCRVGESSSSSVSRMDANNARKRRRIGSGPVNDEDGQRNDYEGSSTAATQGGASGRCPPDVVCSMTLDRNKGNRVGGCSKDRSNRFGSVDDQEQVLMVLPMKVSNPCMVPTMHDTTAAMGGSHGLMCPASLTVPVPFREAVSLDNSNSRTIYPPLQYQDVIPWTQGLGRHLSPSMLRYLGLSHDRMMQQPGEQHY